MRPSVPILAAFVPALLVALLAGSAEADYEETEARLKSIGIGDRMRAEIHAAIDRGVEHLLAIQGADGGFDVPGLAGVPLPSTPMVHEAGRSVLCALALRHAGTPRALEALERARGYLFSPAVRERLEAGVYESGIAAMFVMADPGPRPLARRFAKRLEEYQGRSGWWAYGTIYANAGVENLSTTQFGALGLWAARRSGADVSRDAWLRIAESHVAAQDARGRWGYTRGAGGGAGYPQGTFMGLANLVLAQAALAGDPDSNARLLARVAMARAKATEALAKDVPAFLLSFERTSPPLSYYALYALEKACLFADLESVGGVAWYPRGARALLEKQRKDGGWGPKPAPDAGLRLEDDRVATSFALLFLLRASSVYRPTTPRDVDGKEAEKPPPVTTPSDPAPAR
jgi:hypothetical protein